jgi:hypothetical protein
MPIHLTKCEICPAQFRVKTLKKPYIGMYKNNPVFHWHYVCPVCKHVHTVRFYNKFVNTYFDKVMSLEFSLFLNRKDQEKCEQLLSEYEIAKDVLEFVFDEMKSQLLPIRKI